MFRFWLRIDFFFQFTEVARNQEKALKVLHEFTDKVIMDRREELIRKGNSEEVKNVNAIDDNSNLTSGKRKLAFLDVLLQASIDGKSMTNLDIREEVDTFMFEVIFKTFLLKKC